jgi:hypothetical protein
LSVTPRYLPTNSCGESPAILGGCYQPPECPAEMWRLPRINSRIEERWGGSRKWAVALLDVRRPARKIHHQFQRYKHTSLIFLVGKFALDRRFLAKETILVTFFVTLGRGGALEWGRDRRDKVEGSATRTGYRGSV